MDTISVISFDVNILHQFRVNSQNSLLEPSNVKEFTLNPGYYESDILTVISSLCSIQEQLLISKMECICFLSGKY